MKIQEELKNERRNSVSLAENFDEDRLTSETGGVNVGKRSKSFILFYAMRDRVPFENENRTFFLPLSPLSFISIFYTSLTISLRSLSFLYTTVETLRDVGSEVKMLSKKTETKCCEL